MFEIKRRTIAITKIFALYAQGQRDFSNIMCSGMDFSKAKLSGCNFTNSDLSYGQFENADLSGCNFTDANIEWSGFKSADLRNSNFTKANFQYSILNKAKMEGAILTKTNLTWCLLFDVELNEAQKKTADFTMTAFNSSQVSAEARLAVIHKLAEKKDLLHFETFYRIEFVIKSDNERIQKINVAENAIGSYARNVAYDAKSGGNYSESAPQSSYTGGAINYKTKHNKKDAYRS